MLEWGGNVAYKSEFFKSREPKRVVELSPEQSGPQQYKPKYKSKYFQATAPKEVKTISAQELISTVKPPVKPKPVETPEDRIKKFSQTGYKMTKADRKEVQDYYKKFAELRLQEFKSAKTPQERAEIMERQLADPMQQALSTAEMKSRPLGAFTAGAVASIMPIAKVLATPFTGVERTQEIYAPFEQQLESVSAQSPIEAGVGHFVGKALPYYSGSQLMAGLKPIQKVGEAIGKGASALTGGKIGADVASRVATRLVGDTALDIALVTAPEAVRNAYEGKSAKEITNEALKNVGVNIAWNVGAEAIGSLFKALKNKDVSEVEAEKLKQVTDTMNDIEKSAVATESGFKSGDEMGKKIDEILMLPETATQPTLYGNEIGISSDIDKIIRPIPTVDELIQRAQIANSKGEDLTKYINDIETAKWYDSLSQQEKQLLIDTSKKEIKYSPVSARQIITENYQPKAIISDSVIQRAKRVEAKPLNIDETPSMSIKPTTEAPIQREPIIPQGTKERGFAETVRLKTDMPDFKDFTKAETKAQKTGRNLYNRIFSKTNALERIAKMQDPSKANLEDLSQAVRNSDSATYFISKYGLADSGTGKVIDESFEKVVDVPNARELDEYLQLRHNIARQGEGKPVLDLSAEDSIKKSADMLKKNPELKEQADKLHNWYDKFLNEWGVKSGLISQEQFDSLKKLYPEYIPTYRVDKNVPMSGSTLFGRITGTAKTIKKATGSTRAVKAFEDNFMAKINQTVKAAKKNEVITSLYKFALDNPEQAKAYAKIVDASDTMKNAVKGDLDSFIDTVDSDAIKEVSEGIYRLTGFIGGEPIALDVSEDVFKGINYLFNPRNQMGKTASVIMDLGRKATTPMKQLTTTYNPFFALRNVIRDAQTGYINSITDRKTFTGYMGDIVSSAKEMAQNSDDWKLFLANGGLSGTRYNMDKGLNEYLGKNKNILQKITGKIGDSITWGGEMSESVSRFNEFRNALKKYGRTPDGVRKATQAAADVTVNFARSGDVAKVADAWTQYLNANLQGLDKTARQLKAHPLQTLRRGAEMISAPTIALYLINRNNPYYNELNDNTKDNYFLIPDITDTDADGQSRTFIKLPKSREWGAILGATLERASRTIDGEPPEQAFKNLGEAFKTNYGIANIFTDNLPAQTFTALTFNKNYWGADIVPLSMQKLSPRYQYDYKTSSIAKNLGDKFNWSPKKIDYVIDQLTGFAGDVVLPLTSSQGKGIIETVLEPVKRQFKADPLFSSQSIERFYTAKEEMETIAKDYNFVNDIPPEVTTSFELASSYMNEVSKQISELSQREKNISKTTKDENEIKRIREQKIALAKQIQEMPQKIMSTMDSVSGKVDTSKLQYIPEENKAKVSQYIGDYASNKAQLKEQSKWVQEGLAYANKKGIDRDKFIADLSIAKAATSDIKGRTDARGKTIAGTKKTKIIAKLREMGYTMLEANNIYEIVG